MGLGRLRLLVLVGVFLLAEGALASPWLEAISETYDIIHTAEGDLDGNGTMETAICYEVQKFDRGGILVLETRGNSQRPVLHAQTEELCRKVKIKAGRLGVKFANKNQVIWTLGDNLALLGQPGHPLTGITAEASSTKSKTTLPAYALDRRLDTSWAEGKAGTGIGETLTVTLPRDTYIAAIGIFPGNGNGERAFFANNRIHRLSIQSRTKNDLGDEDSGLDFSDLGIDIGGERIEATLENEPRYRYLSVDKRDVREIEIRIDSVFLGQQTDDVHIAEVEIVPLLKTDAFITAKAERSAKAPPPAPKPKPAPKGKSEAKTRADKALKKLDGDGTSIVDDVEF